MREALISETDLVPYSPSEPVGERVLVLAPHPDDESIGMGGTIRLLTGSGKSVKVVVLTGGERADPSVHDLRQYADLRRKEALKAFRVLGIEQYEFLGFTDRELYRSAGLLRESLETIIGGFRPDTIYSPSIIELNPDHRATAEAALLLVREMPRLRCLFYELTSPFRPSLLVDISRVFSRKRKAIRCYRSQVRLIDYLRFSNALNTYRSFTLGSGVKFAEAFWDVSSCGDHGEIGKWLAYTARY